jgi:predicted transcriptional regulator of viral defense system
MPNSNDLVVTDIERTLVDAAVRPAYAGGPLQVLHAYRLAGSKISLDRILTYLRKMKFIYPYHQAIGYYLEHSGAFNFSELQPLQKLGMDHKFYLDYGIENPAYIKEWQLYVPESMSHK